MDLKNLSGKKVLWVIVALIIALILLSMGGMVFLHAGMMAVVHFLLGK